MSTLIDLILHLDVHLNSIISSYHSLAYLLFFLIVFCETGLVVTPFLPGDSLIFATAALAAGSGRLNAPLAAALFTAAAVAGDTVNYHVGRLLRGRIQKRQHIFMLKQEHIDRTHRFFDRYGGKAIVLGRFIPVIRTFIPFVAGVGTMPFKKFLGYNMLGGISWVTLFFAIGYSFGNLPAVKAHFSLILAAIILISLIPALSAFIGNTHIGKGGAKSAPHRD